MLSSASSKVLVMNTEKVSSSIYYLFPNSPQSYRQVPSRQLGRSCYRVYQVFYGRAECLTNYHVFEGEVKFISLNQAKEVIIELKRKEVSKAVVLESLKTLLAQFSIRHKLSQIQDVLLVGLDYREHLPRSRPVINLHFQQV